MQSLEYLQGRLPQVTVMPSCADLQHFATGAKREGDFVLGYVGAVSSWYLLDTVMDSFRLLLECVPNVLLSVFNRNKHAYLRDRPEAGGVAPETVGIRAAAHAEVRAKMTRMHAGIFLFYEPSSSRLAWAPTKLGEFLGCGIPCLANTGVGDMAAVLEGERVGVAVDAFDPAALDAGLSRLLALVQEPGVRERCVAAAHRHFSLDEGVKRYRAVYNALDAA